MHSRRLARGAPDLRSDSFDSVGIFSVCLPHRAHTDIEPLLCLRWQHAVVESLHKFLEACERVARIVNEVSRRI